MKVLETFLRAGEGEERRKLERKAEKVIALEPKIEQLTDEELTEKTQEFKKRIIQGEKLDNLATEAFAVAREAAWRVLGLKAYKVQLMGGLALHEGKIAEQKTGEGKSLTAIFPAYLNALTEEGVHIVTVNDYLAHYQGQQMGRVFKALGMSTGIMQNGQTIPEKREQYNADITYGTNNEFGFDYLKDNMVQDMDEKVQRGHNFAIVDEVDSILIDEARTPLIISGPAQSQVDKWFSIFAKIAKTLTIDEHYEVDLKKRTVSILPEGISKVEDALGIDNLYVKERTPLIGYLNNSVKAKELFKKDKDYVVREGEIQIVDEHTGRILKGRRYNDGIHQAIEAKERVEVMPENQTYATITVQNYFKLYNKLSGMTGTAETESAEFSGTYKLGVLPIPTNKPVVRIDKPDKIYRTEQAKFEAVVEDIVKRHETGQPILVGTASVSRSEYLSKKLHEAGVKHNVLNAKQHEKEANVVALAGLKNAVTVATNMAGRGTDIILGGNVDFLTTQILEEKGLTPEGTPEEYEKEWNKVFAEVSEQVEKEAEEVRELGGLCVIGTERHESRRIDNQLRGRSGRQGDPGETIFYLSLQDELVKRFNSGNSLDAIISRVVDDSVPISGKFVSGSIQTAQKQIESMNFESRKNILKYDEVLTKQRDIVYSDRDKVLANYDLMKTLVVYIQDVISSIVDRTYDKKNITEEQLDEILETMSKIYPVTLTKDRLLQEYGNVKKIDADVLEKEFLADADLAFDRREKEIGADRMNELIAKIMIEVIDKRWREHLYEMDYLKEGISLRAMAQKDPLVEYNEEGYRMFKNLRNIVKEDVVMYVFNAEVSVKDAEQLSKMVPEEVQKLLSSAQKNPKLSTNKDVADEETLTKAEKDKAAKSKSSASHSKDKNGKTSSSKSSKKKASADSVIAQVNADTRKAVNAQVGRNNSQNNQNGNGQPMNRAERRKANKKKSIN